MSALAAALALAAAATGARLCDGGLFDQFDFWLGEWSIEQHVHQPDGTIESYPARTNVTRSADGCVITEHWRGTTRLSWYGMERPETLWGYSVRRVDPATREWLISWIDEKSPRFAAPFIGGFKGDQGIFFQEGAKRRGRIRFIRRRDGTIHWDLATSPSAGDAWRMLWEMDMHSLSADRDQ
jgi:hypothetical protein